MANRPGGELGARPLHFIWIADCSGSMEGTKIEALNLAIRESIPPMREVAKENPQAQVLVRAIKFSSGAQWHHSQPTLIHDFEWNDLNAGGETDMGKALTLAAEALKSDIIGNNGLPPVLVLITDGEHTDKFKEGLKTLMAQPWGAKAVRLAVAIGDDAKLDALQEFIGHPEIKPLQSTNSADLANKIKWVSTVPLKSVAAPATTTKNASDSSLNIPIPAPPKNIAAVNPNDVF